MFARIVQLVLAFTGLLIILWAIFVAETARLMPIGLLLIVISSSLSAVAILKKSSNSRGKKKGH